MTEPVISDEQLIATIRGEVSTLVGRLLLPAQDDQALAEIVPDRYDSLRVLDCVGLIEQRFGVSIDLVDDDLRVTFRSVASIAALVCQKLRDAAVLGNRP
jgi:acyl carrier protein